uniref:Putative secreted protein n=1 Tax=Ixodes ricinus TaxID=34613 RepID=A0A6B0UBH4_IXORI
MAIMFLVFCAEYVNVLKYGFVRFVSALLFWLRGLKIVFSLTQTFSTCPSYLQLKQTSPSLSPFSLLGLFLPFPPGLSLSVRRCVMPAWL